MEVMPVSLTNDHNLLTRGFSVSSPLKHTCEVFHHSHSYTFQLKSPSNAKASWVRMATEKAQAPIGGASFLESSSKEIQGDIILLTLVYCKTLDADQVWPSLAMLYRHFKFLFAFLG